MGDMVPQKLNLSTRQSLRQTHRARAHSALQQAGRTAAHTAPKYVQIPAHTPKKSLRADRLCRGLPPGGGARVHVLRRRGLGGAAAALLSVLLLQLLLLELPLLLDLPLVVGLHDLGHVLEFRREGVLPQELMPQSVVRGDPLVGVAREELVKQIELVVCDACAVGPHQVLELRVPRLPAHVARARELEPAGPSLRRGRPTDLENLGDLLTLVVRPLDAGERPDIAELVDGQLEEQLRKDAPDRPHVGRRAVLLRLEEHLGGAVPESDNLLGEGH
mmetsp:Transcript_7362/g.18375  ORF Transcript_7362/g.18375 Transcript_7362/m.18375 type:complete len:275 (+) Transcript_7362:86-910(+)